MSKYDNVFIMTQQVYSRTANKHGFDALTCPTCDNPIYVGMKVHSKVKSGKNKHALRHFDCAVQVNLMMIPTMYVAFVGPQEEYAPFHRPCQRCGRMTHCIVYRIDDGEARWRSLCPYDGETYDAPAGDYEEELPDVT